MSCSKCKGSCNIRQQWSDYINTNPRGVSEDFEDFTFQFKMFTGPYVLLRWLNTNATEKRDSDSV